MLLFIALPIVSVITQSVFIPHEQVIVEVENCGPFGCEKSTAIDQEATNKLRQTQPLGRFAGADIYFDRAHLAINEVTEAWRESSGIVEFTGAIEQSPILWGLSVHINVYRACDPLVDRLGFLDCVGC